jgi:hypothetical protein
MQGNMTLFPDISGDPTLNINLMGDDDLVYLKNINNSNFIKKYMYQLQVNISVRGHEKRFVGQNVNIQWPSSNENEYIHKAMDGKYLITTIINQFNGKMSPPWIQNIMLIKTAYTNSDAKMLLKSSIVKESNKGLSKK